MPGSLEPLSQEIAFCSAHADVVVVVGGLGQLGTVVIL